MSQRDQRNFEANKNADKSKTSTEKSEKFGKDQYSTKSKGESNKSNDKSDKPYGQNVSGKSNVKQSEQGSRKENSSKLKFDQPKQGADKSTPTETKQSNAWNKSSK